MGYSLFHENGSSSEHSFDEHYLSLSTQVAKGTVFRKHTVFNVLLFSFQRGLDNNHNGTAVFWPNHKGKKKPSSLDLGKPQKKPPGPLPDPPLNGPAIEERNCFLRLPLKGQPIF